MSVMEIYTFTFKMVNKTKISGSERVAGLTPPLNGPNQSQIHKETHIISRRQCFHVMPYESSLFIILKYAFMNRFRIEAKKKNHIILLSNSTS